MKLILKLFGQNGTEINNELAAIISFKWKKMLKTFKSSYNQHVREDMITSW